MQKQYSIDHLVIISNSRVWSVVLQWLAYDWITGFETVTYTENYFQLWSPVQSEIEEFPY